ncbi:hypothetical protein PMAYCL1PPCAC_19374, partial [Pristionchus mayeri]
LGLGELVSLAETTGLASGGGRVLGDPVRGEHTEGSATLSDASLEYDIMLHGLLSNAGHKHT